MKQHDLAGTARRPIGRSRAAVLLALILAGGGLAQPTPANAVGRINRPGVYSIGAWYQYGMVEGKSRYGLDFNRGSGYSVQFRYITGRKTALSVYFDNQTFGAKSDSLVNVRFTAVHGGVRLFSIPNGDVLRYLELTVGFYRPEIRRPKTFQSSIGDDVSFPSNGVMLHAGAGIEIFFTPAWAMQLGGHGYLLKGRGLASTEVYNGEEDYSVTGQVALGLTYYLLR